MEKSEKLAVITPSGEEAPPIFETDEKVVLPAEPYRGIRPFRYADRYVFAAREWEKEQLINLVTQYRGTLVFGQSGIGKSSIINAALIPALLDHRFRAEVLRVSPNRDGTFIVYRVLQSDDLGEKVFLPSLFADAGSDKTEISLSFDEFRKIICAQSYPKPKRGEKNTTEESDLPIPVLIFDQFEELITLFEETGRQSIPGNEIPYEDRRAFQLKLLSLFKDCYYDPYLRVKFIFVFREDYLAKFSRLLRAIPDLRDHSLRIKAIDKEDIFDIIKCPFLRDESKTVYQHSFITDDNEDFILLLTQKLKEYFHEREVVLTEIQIVCQYLYEESPEKRMTHFRDEKGEVAEPIRNIIQLFYEKLLNSLDDGDKPLAIDILSLLVLNEHTRNIFHREAIAEELKEAYPVEAIFAVLTKLDDDTKLIKSEIRSGGIYYEINSESLIPYINTKKIEKATVIHETRKLKEDLERQRIALIEENFATLTAAKKETDEANAALLTAKTKTDEANAALRAAIKEKDEANVALWAANARKRRTNGLLKILTAGVAGLAALALLFMVNSRHKASTIAEKVVELKKKTDSIDAANMDIRKQKDNIGYLNDSLKLHNHLNDSLNFELLRSEARLLAVQKSSFDSLEHKNGEIKTLNDSLQGTVLTLSEQSNSLQTEAAMNYLELQPFYKSLNNSPDTADVQMAADAVATLTQLKLGSHYSNRNTENDNSASPPQYSLLLNDLNQAAQIKSSARTDNNPLRAILQIGAQYSTDHSKFVGQIGLSLVNSQWINIQNIILPQSDYSTENFISPQLRAVAKDNAHFAFAEGAELAIARYDGKYIDGYVNLPLTDLIPENNDYFTNSPPKAIGFNDQGNLMILKQGSVFEYGVQEKKVLPLKMNVDKTINIAAFSPDGHKLISDSYTMNRLGRHFSIQVYDLNDRSKRSIPINSGLINRIMVSGDNKHVIVVDNLNNSWMVDLSKPDALPVKIAGARRFLGVTPDGNHVLAAFIKGSNTDVERWGFDLKEAASIEIDNMIVQEAMLSEDGKSLLVTGDKFSYQPGAFYIKRLKEGAPIFNPSKDGNSDSGAYQYISLPQQAYLNLFSDNSLINLGNVGYYRSIKVFKRFASFSDFKPAYQAVIASLTPAEKVKNEVLPPEAIYSEDENLIYSTAKGIQILNGRTMENNRKRLEIALKLYDKLLEKNATNPNYVADYRSLISTIFSIDGSYKDYTDGYKKVIQAEEGILKNAPVNKYSPLPSALARDYGNLAWYSLFIKGQDYNQVIRAARRGFEIDSTIDFIITNLALGYLFNSDFDSARIVYEKYKGRYCHTCADPSTFPVAFMNDLNDLKTNGLFPDGSELESRRQKLVRFLDSNETVLNW